MPGRCCNGSALEQIEFAFRQRPLDVLSRSETTLAFEPQGDQTAQRLVVEACGCLLDSIHVRFARPTTANRPDGNIFLPGQSLDHGASASDDVMVGSDQSGHYRLTEPPGCFHHKPLIRA